MAYGKRAPWHRLSRAALILPIVIFVAARAMIRDVWAIAVVIAIPLIPCGAVGYLTGTCAAGIFLV